MLILILTDRLFVYICHAKNQNKWRGLRALSLCFCTRSLCEWSEWLCAVLPAGFDRVVETSDRNHPEIVGIVLGHQTVFVIWACTLTPGIRSSYTCLHKIYIQNKRVNKRLRFTYMQSTFMSANCITWMSWNQREIDLSSCANWSGHEVLLPPQVIPVSLCCTSEIFCPLQRATMPLRLPLHPPWKAASRITSPSTRSSIACEHTPSVWATTYLTEPLYVSLIIFIIVMVQRFHFVYHHVLESPYIPSYTEIFISTKIHLYLRNITIAHTNLTTPFRTA